MHSNWKEHQPKKITYTYVCVYILIYTVVYEPKTYNGYTPKKQKSFQNNTEDNHQITNEESKRGRKEQKPFNTKTTKKY